MLRSLFNSLVLPRLGNSCFVYPDPRIRRGYRIWI